MGVETKTVAFTVDVDQLLYDDLTIPNLVFFSCFN